MSFKVKLKAKRTAARELRGHVPELGIRGSEATRS